MYIKTEELISIYYTFENSCFLRLAIEKPYSGELYDFPKIQDCTLKIIKCEHYSDLSLFSLPEILNNIEKTKDSYYGSEYLKDIDIWCNQHKTLEKILKRQCKGTLDFQETSIILRQHISNLYKSLEKFNKVIINEGINTTIPYFNEAILIGTFGLYNDVFKPK